MPQAPQQTALGMAEPLCVMSVASGTGGVEGKGAISQLQEFVQGAKLFPMPAKCPVLQWEYDTRMVATCLEFRATAAFLLDGVPHHTVGVWRPSKKIAQRDAAERALGLFVNRWGELAVAELYGNEKVPAEPVPGAPGNGDATFQNGECTDLRIALEAFCNRRSPTPAGPPQWSHRWDGDRCQAFVELRLLDVAHTFPGRACSSQEEAYTDAARRVLWYLQCPGFEDAYEPDAEFVKAAAHVIPEPSASWVKDDETEAIEEQQLAERKTTIMRVQNRLQQAYARQLEAGTRVWSWSYERGPKDKCWPPLFRATVNVPLAGRSFSGAWKRGQREAQIDACVQISQFLDEAFPKVRGSALA